MCAFEVLKQVSVRLSIERPSSYRTERASMMTLWTRTSALIILPSRWNNGIP